MNLSYRSRRSRQSADHAAPGPHSHLPDGDELRARAYLKAALDSPAPAAERVEWHRTQRLDHPDLPVPPIELHQHFHAADTTLPPTEERTFTLRRLTGNKPRLLAIATGAAAQPALYTFADNAGPLAPVGAAFMCALVTGTWRLRHDGPITRWLFTFNLSAGLLYLPTFKIIVTVITGVSE
ncbi:hypothetical protein OG749_47180 (plasmid) [Streptomyces nojiriensis]|uniref:hypothetical protein n=1 Tax=Streptomyces nojiriensis TaxID=66374 RepID=UPI002E185870